MEKIKSKKSYNIDFEDLFDDNELSKKKRKKKKKKSKKNNKHKSSKKSSNLSKKEKKKIKNDIEITSDFFGLNNSQKKQLSKRYDNKVVHRHEKSLLGRIADSVNLDAKINVDISDDTINNLFLIAAGVITKLLIKK